MLALFLRLETIGQRHLWYDELYTFDFCKTAGSISAVWKAALVDGWEHPPLHYLISYLAYSLNSSASVFRSPSALLGTASVALIMLLGRRLAGDTTALLAGLMLSLSVYHINYSQDARPYAMMLFFVLGAYLSFYRYLDKRTLYSSIPFSLLVCGALYTHHLSIPALAALFFPTISVLYGSAKRAGQTVAPSGFKHFLLWLTASIIIIAALYAWQFNNLLQFLGSGKLVPEHYLTVSSELLLAIEGRWGFGQSGFAKYCGLIILASGILISVIQKSRMRVCIPWLLLPFLLFIVLPFNKFYDLRFSMTALPAFYLLTAFSLAQGCTYLSLPFLKIPQVCPCKLCLSLITCVIIYCGMTTYLVYRSTDYRCSNFFHTPEFAHRNDGFCKKHIILNSLFEENSFLLEKVDHNAHKEL